MSYDEAKLRDLLLKKEAAWHRLKEFPTSKSTKTVEERIAMDIEYQKAVNESFAAEQDYKKALNEAINANLQEPV